MGKYMKIKYLTYIKSMMFWVFFLTLPFALMEQFIYQAASSDEDRIFYGCVGIILGFIETLLLTLLLGHGIHKYENPNFMPLNRYYGKNLRDLIIETFRGMGRIAVGLLLLWPGFRRMVAYYLIPYVVQFDSGYQEGKVDVLEECERLLKGHFLKFSGILCLTQVAMLGIQIISINFNLFTTPLAWILFYVSEATLQTCVFLMFYNYYKSLKR